jgi:tRNA(Arg) A34 adenosine deaminase TadA
MTDDTVHAFMRQAIQIAEENVTSGTGGPFGCVIVKDGEVLSTGSNQVTGSHDPTAHAEIVAIRKACALLGSFQLTECDVFSSCEPCPMCLGALYWARPRRIYFAADQDDAASAGFDDAHIREQLQKTFPEQSLPMERLLETEGKRPFAAWIKSTTRTPY